MRAQGATQLFLRAYCDRHSHALRRARRGPPRGGLVHGMPSALRKSPLVGGGMQCERLFQVQQVRRDRWCVAKQAARPLLLHCKRACAIADSPRVLHAPAQHQNAHQGLPPTTVMSGACNGARQGRVNGHSALYVVAVRARHAKDLWCLRFHRLRHQGSFHHHLCQPNHPHPCSPPVML